MSDKDKQKRKAKPDDVAADETKATVKPEPGTAATLQSDTRAVHYPHMKVDVLDTNPNASC